jgi:protoporphyrinogen oxidase
MDLNSSPHPSRKVIIIGAGPAGLTAAYRLSKAGVRSIVLEKDQVVGGLSRTVTYKDYHFDIGGHRFFTKSQEVEDVWREVLREGFLRRQRKSRIFYNKKFFHYPLRPLNALLGLGVWNSVLVVFSFLRSRLAPYKDEETFEQWVSNRFGRRLFNVFFKTYTEKVWGIPCSEIRAEWAAQRIKGLSLVSALKNALVKPRPGGKGKKDVIKTLIDEFDYPEFGPGMMWSQVSSCLHQNGSEVWLDAEVDGILWSDTRVEGVKVMRNGRREIVRGTDFISSMPLREVVQNLQPPAPPEVLAAANKLRYRDFLTVALIIRKPDVFPDNWIYIHDPNVRVGRIQNFKNWSPRMVPNPGKTCLGLEYFCFEGDSLWNMPDRELIRLAVDELVTLGFVQAEDVEDGAVVRMPKAYPIYDSTSQDSVTVIRRFLDQLGNFQAVGRNGQHRYNNQDHSMLTAMRAAENVQGERHDLWEVTEENEYLEEIRMKPAERAAWFGLLAKTFARMDKLSFAIALGSVSGLGVFLATLLLVAKGGPVVGPNLQLLSQYFNGYTVTFKGALIGFGYSFFWGFLFGWLFAYLRNASLGYFIYRVRRKAALLKFKSFLDQF